MIIPMTTPKWNVCIHRDREFLTEPMIFTELCLAFHDKMDKTDLQSLQVPHFLSSSQSDSSLFSWSPRGNTGTTRPFLSRRKEGGIPVTEASSPLCILRSPAASTAFSNTGDGWLRGELIIGNNHVSTTLVDQLNDGGANLSKIVSQTKTLFQKFGRMISNLERFGTTAKNLISQIFFCSV